MLETNKTIETPNLGKSSVINSLRRAKAVGVSSTPGFTKCVKEVEIELNIKILDCPGIVLGYNFDPDFVLKNVVRIENIEDFYAPVNRIYEEVEEERMQSIYEVDDFGSTTEFLGNLARKSGK